jgi:hypothetical protein
MLFWLVVGEKLLPEMIKVTPPNGLNMIGLMLVIFGVEAHVYVTVGGVK